MGFSRRRMGRDGKPRYTAYYLDIRSRQRSAGTALGEPSIHHGREVPPASLLANATPSRNSPKTARVAERLSRVASVRR
jgi:hypothetical protein